MNKTERAIEAIENAIAKIIEKIDNPNTPEMGPESKNQLFNFLSILNLMKRKLAGDDQIDDNKIYNMGHIIIDSWPLADSLGATIIQAEQGYKKVIFSKNIVEN
jgi:hypothetical protein